MIFFFLCWTQKAILKNMGIDLMGSIDFQKFIKPKVVVTNFI